MKNIDKRKVSFEEIYNNTLYELKKVGIKVRKYNRLKTAIEIALEHYAEREWFSTRKINYKDFLCEDDIELLKFYIVDDIRDYYYDELLEL